MADAEPALPAADSTWRRGCGALPRQDSERRHGGNHIYRAACINRKFAHSLTQFAYAGQPLPGQDPGAVGKAFDDRGFSFGPANIPANVSGQIKDRIPNLPIITLATATSTLQVGDGSTPTVWQPVVDKSSRERWNDWGIGLLLQGDLKGAEYAFTQVTKAEPEYADGWLNVARALIQEGETEAAKPFIREALARNDTLGAHPLFQGPDRESRRRLRGGDCVA